LKAYELACFTIIISKSFINLLFHYQIHYIFTHHHIVLIALGYIENQFRIRWDTNQGWLNPI